jgi:hypothetical protein
VRKLIKIALVALGIRALLRWWKRRRAAAAELDPGPQHADPADQLRQKLAESRVEEPESAESEDTPVEASVADRRAEVHEQGRATLDEMKTSDEA